MTDFRELWKEGKPTLSFEFYPARTEKGSLKLAETIRDLAARKPDFVSVTFGAGGSSRDGSLQLLKDLVALKGPKVVGYVAAYGLNPSDLDWILLKYIEAGADSILCVRGDDPDIEGFKPDPLSFAHAVELVARVRALHALPLGVAGYPEGHVDAPDRRTDWNYLKQKVDKGADYIISQYFYDSRYFFEFRDQCRNLGVKVPILAGVMPVYSVKTTRSLAERCGASLTAEIEDFFSRIDPEDKEAVERFGIDLAVRQCRELIAAGVDGLHFYTMDRRSSVEAVLDRLHGEGLLS